MAYEDVAEVYWAADPQDAHQVRALLEEAGVRARVVGEMLSAAAGELPMGPAGSPRVWVPKSDEARARQVVEDWEKKRNTERAGEGWKCPQCGAAVDANFDICWNCQSAR